MTKYILHVTFPVKESVICPEFARNNPLKLTKVLFIKKTTNQGIIKKLTLNLQDIAPSQLQVSHVVPLAKVMWPLLQTIGQAA